MASLPKNWRELQRLAMKNGVKANQSRDVIEEQLREILAAKDESKCANVLHDTPSLQPGETDGSSPDASQGNTTTPESSPDSNVMKRVSHSRRLVSSISTSVQKALRTISSPLKSLTSPSRPEEQRPSFVQDLNNRFGNEDPSSYMSRFDSADSSSSNDGGVSNLSNSGNDEDEDFGCEGVDSADDHVAEIIGGMNQLTLSVDIDGINGTSEERATDLPTLSELRFEFPAGNLGLILKKDEYGNTEVKEVKKTCPLRDYIIRGDILLYVDDLETRKLPLDDVCEIAMGRSYYPRSLCFGRNVASRQDPKAKSRRQGMSTSTTGVRSIARNVVAGTSRLVPTNIASAIAHAAKEKKNALFNYKGLKVGSRAVKFSQLKGREAEIARGRLGKRFIKYDEMITPWYEDENGNPTSEWEPIIPFLIIVDPIVETDINGGTHEYDTKHFRKRRKVVVLVAADKIQLAKAVMKDLCESHFESSSDYEVEIVSCSNDFMVAMNGDRTKEKAKTPKKKQNDLESRPTINLAATPIPSR